MLADAVDVAIRARIRWLSGRIMESHLLSGEKRRRRAPRENELGTCNFDTFNPSPSSGFLCRSWKTLISEFVDTAMRFPFSLKAAAVILASPFIRIFATSLRSLADESSSCSFLEPLEGLLSFQICTSRSHQLITNRCLGALRTIGS